MSTVKDTTKLKPYRRSSLPNIDENVLPYLARELDVVAASLSAAITALKSIEARIVAGGL